MSNFDTGYQFKSESPERRALRRAAYESGPRYRALNMALSAAVRAVEELRTQVYALVDEPGAAIRLYDAEHPDEKEAIINEAQLVLGMRRGHEIS